MTTVISELIAERDALVAELERVKAERDRLLAESIPNGNLMHRSELEARLDKALAALQHELGVTHGETTIRRIKAAIAEIEGRYDDIPGAGQRGC